MDFYLFLNKICLYYFKFSITVNLLFFKYLIGL